MKVKNAKPCPFCGSGDIHFHDDSGLEFMLCHNCQSTGPDGNGKTEAIANWNRRELNEDLILIKKSELDKLTDAHKQTEIE